MRKVISTLVALIALVSFSLPVAFAQVPAGYTAIRRQAFHITTNATTAVSGQTGYIYSIVVSVSVAGASSNTFTIRNKEGTPKIFFTATNIAVGTTVISVREPLLATSGIEVVTATGTAPTADVFITYALQ